MIKCMISLSFTTYSYSVKIFYFVSVITQVRSFLCLCMVTYLDVNDNHLDIPLNICLQSASKLTSWGGHHPSAHQRSPAWAPLGRRCHCRNLDTHFSPARLTRTWETGRRKSRRYSREMKVKGSVQGSDIL